VFSDAPAPADEWLPSGRITACLNQIIGDLGRQGCDTVVFGCSQVPILVRSDNIPANWQLTPPRRRQARQFGLWFANLPGMLADVIGRAKVGRFSLPPNHQAQVHIAAGYLVFVPAPVKFVDRNKSAAASK
jgi:hypothetical protein